MPYIFEKIYARARRAAEEAGRLEVFGKAVELAVRYAEAVERRGLGTGPGPGAALRVQHALYDRLVYERMRAVLGGRARYVVSGGSPLSRHTGLVFAGAGITIYDGYGLTETSAAVTGQPVGRVKFGTVGRPLPGCSVRIAWDGEIWIRGDTVFAGYLNDRPSTEAVLRDGWLATGDVGSLDDEGYLTITGRKKDIIKTSGGRASPRPCWRSGYGPTRWSRSAWWWRQPAVHLRLGHPGPRSSRPLAAAAQQAGGGHPS